MSKPAQAKVYAALEMLTEEGRELRMPMSRNLGQGLYELRIPHPEGPFRIIYCLQSGRRILLLHGFVKRTEQTSQRELDLARGRKPEE